MVLLLLPSREYHGPDYEPGVPHIYALRRRFFADIIELHVFRSTEAIIPAPCDDCARISLAGTLDS
jgi:hypothetical protein